jgi:cyclopropane-fatty-acyl-phospholipid synthase
VTTLPALKDPATLSWFSHKLRDALESRLDGLHGSVQLREAWSGRTRELGRGDRAATITIEDPAFYGDVALGGAIGAAEAYAAGRWNCDDLPELVALLVNNRQVLDSL